MLRCHGCLEFRSLYYGAVNRFSQLWLTFLKIFGEGFSDYKGSVPRGISKQKLMLWLVLEQLYVIVMLFCGNNKWRGETPCSFSFTQFRCSLWSTTLHTTCWPYFQEETVSTAWFCYWCLQNPCQVLGRGSTGTPPLAFSCHFVWARTLCFCFVHWHGYLFITVWLALHGLASQLLISSLCGSIMCPYILSSWRVISDAVSK